MAGKGNPRTGGRARGTPNKLTSDLKELMHSILMDEQEVTREKLEALRDSHEATDRKTFWTLAAKMLPQLVEGKIEGDLPRLTLIQDFVRGETYEIEDEDKPGSTGKGGRRWEE